MAGKRSNRDIKLKRRRQSRDVQQELVDIIENVNNKPILRQSAIQKLVALNRRHRLKMPKSVGILFCKKCLTFYDSENSRTRIKNGQIIKSCHICQDVRRLGGGPKHHRR